MLAVVPLPPCAVRASRAWLRGPAVVVLRGSMRTSRLQGGAAQKQHSAVQKQKSGTPGPFKQRAARLSPRGSEGIWRAGAVLVSVGRRMPYESVLSDPLVDGSPLGGNPIEPTQPSSSEFDSLFQGGSNAAVSHRTRLCDAPLLEGLATYRISLGARVCTDKMPKGEKPVEFCFGERGAFGHAMRPFAPIKKRMSDNTGRWEKRIKPTCNTIYPGLLQECHLL